MNKTLAKAWLTLVCLTLISGLSYLAGRYPLIGYFLGIWVLAMVGLYGTAWALVTLEEESPGGKKK